MTRQVEFLFDFGSPTAYLAYKQLPGIARRAGATISWQPILLGGVFKGSGNAAPGTVPAKGRYMGQDLQRFARRYGVPLKHNPFFPINTIAMMRGAVATQRHGGFERYMEVIYDAMWVEERNMGERAELEKAVAAAGLDPATFFAWIEDPAIKEELRSATERAVARGVFGAPTFFVGEEMFFGQDRLDFVAEALERQPA